MNHALQEIREASRKGRLKAGDRLIETQLAQEMQISRFPIREAHAETLSQRSDLKIAIR